MGGGGTFYLPTNTDWKRLFLKMPFSFTGLGELGGQARPAPPPPPPPPPPQFPFHTDLHTMSLDVASINTTWPGQNPLASPTPALPIPINSRSPGWICCQIASRSRHYCPRSSRWYGFIDSATVNCSYAVLLGRPEFM